MKNIAQQIAAMHEHHPAFRVVHHDDRTAAWEGVLSPTAKHYKVRIAYRTPIIGQVFTIAGVQPRVTVLSPILERHPDYEEGPIPHVYWDQDDIDRPILCLFSPEGWEWTLDDLIADTTVYWAARWLFFYEGWLATKKWKGGGRHPAHMREDKTLASV